jgi:serine/threonine-protein kinase
MSAALPPPPGIAPGDVPTHIGAYDVRGVIGTGSMGVVYLAHDPIINRPVAIKTIQRHLLDAGAQHQGAAARFRLEAQAAGRLNHRNIVSVYQFGQDQACAYIVMEFVEGHSLGEYLRRPERLTRDEVMCLMFQLLDALHYAHEAGVVHRDIKPANLMIDRDGRLKVTDFGIARTESSQVTRANTVIGSPGYMAPEQYTGAAVDRRVDIFAAGVLLYKLLSGVTPFTGSDEAIMYQIVYGQHGQLSMRGGDASLAVFDAIIDSALAKLPAQRFASALDFREALKAVAGAAVPERIAPQRMLPPRNVAASQTEPTRVVPPPQAPGGFVNSVLPSSLPVPTGWDEIDLADLERELTRYVGPVAKVLVRRAARDQVDIREVRRLVASSIVDPEVREQFLSATDGSGSRPAFSHSKPQFGNSVLPSRSFTDTQGPVSLEGTPLQDKDVENAGAALSVVIGPIGKVLARRCAEGAGTRERFVSRVLEQLTARVDAKQVETALWRSMI